VNAKVQAAGAAGAATTLLVWLANLFGVNVPPEAAAAATTLLATLAGYLKPETAPPTQGRNHV
jgi:hypothetical protein